MRKIFAIFSLVVIAALGGCKKVNPTDGVEKIIDASFSKTSVSFQFVDANTGLQLDLDGNRDITVSITGRNAADVVDNFGGSHFGADYGMMAVALQKGVVPSITNQIEFSVHAETSGYLPASKTCVIIQEGHQHYIIQMINIADAPEGITIAEDVIASVPSSGVISSTFTLSPSALSTSGTTATLTIPSGTKLMDVNSVAAPGNLTATLAYSNPNEAAFYQQFPGDPYKSQLTTGDYVSFKSLGIASIDIKNPSNGCEVRNFDSPVQMSMEIPNGMTAINGDPVGVGSTFGIYSYSEETGKWTHEGDETVTLNSGSGKLEVNFEMTHLSTWQCADKASTSSSNNYNQVVYQGSCADYFNTQQNIIYEWRYMQDGTWLVSNTEIANTPLNQTMYLKSVHANNVSWATGRKYRWYQEGNPSDYVEANADYGQSLQTVTFPSSWCPSTPAKEFTVKLTTNCPDNPDHKIKPQCTVFAWEEGFGKMILLGQMISGELKTTTGNFDLSKKYALVTFYQNKLVVLTGSLNNLDFGFRTIDGNDIDLSRPLTSLECTYLKTK